MPKISQTYVHHGREFSVVTRAEGEVIESLPPGNYRLNFHELRGWWFSEMQQFNLPEKLYGNVDKRASRILDTYRSRMEKDKPTGVLLEGIKGSGKTLLAKRVAESSGLPVILINTPYTSDDFKEILANIGKCVVIFDEFEKVYYENEKQNAVLTLLDGVFSSSVLTFVIVNDANKLVGPLMNRPGRLFYSLQYGGLSEEFIREYVADRLHPAKYSEGVRMGEVDDEESTKRVQGVLSVSAMFKHFTFDHLQAVVEEMNRYGEPAEEVIEFLNVKIPKPSFFDVYEVSVTLDGKDITNLQKKSITVQSSVPISESRYFSYDTGEIDSDGDKIEAYLYIGPKALIKTDIPNSTFVFGSDDGRVKVSYVKANDERRYQLMNDSDAF